MGSSAYLPHGNFTQPVTPTPPRLHWGWVLALSLLTRGFFGEVWLIVQANWIRRTTGRSQAQTWAIVNLCAIPVMLIGAVGFGVAAGTQSFALAGNSAPWHAVEAAVGVTIFVLHVVTVFKVRAELEAEPIAIPLGGVMTFFFGALYFQYFLRDWVPMDYSIAPTELRYVFPNEPPRV